MSEEAANAYAESFQQVSNRYPLIGDAFGASDCRISYSYAVRLALNQHWMIPRPTMAPPRDGGATILRTSGARNRQSELRWA